MGTYSAKQKRVKVDVIGGKEIGRRLKAMGETASAILMKAAKSGGEIALKDAKKHCPVDTGRLRNSLAIHEVSATDRRATIKVDYDKSIKYGAFVELGANGRKSNPFLRNAVDKNVDDINEEITETLAKAVVKKW